MNIKERKEQDTRITREFLAVPDNHANAAYIAGECAQLLQNLNRYGHYYLKGGNAFSLLSGVAVTGDWDFQFRPDDAVYADWENQFPHLDQMILMGLMQIARDANIPHDWQTNQIFNYNGLAGEKAGNSFKIGPRFMTRTLGNVLDDAAYNSDTGRIEGLNANEIEFFGEADAVAPVIYVNYTIPGFILYRMVYMFHYQLGEDEFNLKSEIIDISVPRKGSSEVVMAQEGVITHFRQVGGFRIPGWGYHFYENLNLLQEIMLDASASEAKKAKRRVRGDRALQELFNLWLVQNQGQKMIDFCCSNIGWMEPGAPNQPIISLVEAMTLNLEGSMMRAEITQRFAEALKTFMIPTAPGIEVLASFDINKVYHNAVSVGDVTSAFLLSLKQKSSVPKERLSFISPFYGLKVEERFPLVYVLMEAVPADFATLTKEVNVSLGNLELKRKTAGCIVLKGTAANIYYCILLRNGDPAPYSVYDYLMKSILFSQRMGIARIYERE